MIEIAASILSLDIFSFKDEIERIKPFIDRFHLDIMDGHFVPPISFGQQFIKNLRPISDVPFDVHLMITNPEAQVESFLEAGGDIIIVHIETVSEFSKIKTFINSYGKKIGLSISPNTSINKITPYLEEIDVLLIMTVYPGYSGQKFIEESINIINKVRKLKQEKSLIFKIMVDGGINYTTARGVIEAGAEILVIGTGLFSSADPVKELEKIRSIYNSTIH